MALQFQGFNAAFIFHAVQCYGMDHQFTDFLTTWLDQPGCISVFESKSKICKNKNDQSRSIIH